MIGKILRPSPEASKRQYGKVDLAKVKEAFASAKCCGCRTC